jgi:hypothetical protein
MITISARRCTFDRLRRGARGRERCCGYWFSMARSSRSQRTAGLGGFLFVGMGGRFWALLGIVQTVAIDLSVLNAPNEWHWSYFLMLLGHSRSSARRPGGTPDGVSGNKLVRALGGLRKGRKLKPRLAPEAARRGQPVPTVHQHEARPPVARSAKRTV